jgi:hypothetical protein
LGNIIKGSIFEDALCYTKLQDYQNLRYKCMRLPPVIALTFEKTTFGQKIQFRFGNFDAPLRRNINLKDK